MAKWVSLYPVTLCIFLLTSAVLSQDQTETTKQDNNQTRPPPSQAPANSTAESTTASEGENKSTTGGYLEGNLIVMPVCIIVLSKMLVYDGH